MNTRRPIFLVFTGGPCAGKSTAISLVSRTLTDRGWKVFFVPEIAISLIQSGITPQNVGSYLFQSFVLRTQIARECLVEESALIQNGRTVVLCDRGALDGRAYIGKTQFAKIVHGLGHKVLSMRDVRYDNIFHLVTSAIGAEKFYENTSIRKESIREARKLDGATRLAWLGHPHMKIIGNETGGFAGKMRRLTNAVFEAVGEPPIERERKFLIKPFSVSQLPTAYVRIDIVQHYLVSTDSKEEVRIRKRTQDKSSLYYLTTKTDVGVGERVERERLISEKEYVRLMSKVRNDTCPIIKRRFYFIWENQIFELDIFRSNLSGRFILECEHTKDGIEVQLPPFINVIKEVTDNLNFRNCAFASAR